VNSAPKRIIIVGAGFYGLTIAEIAARELGVQVIVLEKRDHIGGNAYSYFDDDTKIEVHKYGTHIFHTNVKKVWDYVNRFAVFNDYQHRVMVNFENKCFTIPITLDTICRVYDQFLSPEQARNLIEMRVRKTGNDDLESWVLGEVGPDIYQTLIEGYTFKQWGMKPSSLPKEIIKRIPIRYNFDTRYFTDTYQGIPIGGYGKLFQKMTSDPRIEVKLNHDFIHDKEEIRANDLLIYTGPIDRFFDYEFGELSWRTLEFEFQKLDTKDFQGCSVVNYTDSKVPYTRVHEFKHLHPEQPESEKTIIAYEFSKLASKIDDPYYPINTKTDREILLKYREKASQLKNVVFGGRLGSYQYLDMHMAIASALTDYEGLVKEWFKSD
jgi:UDP-galactopyranose mutase